MTRDPICTRFVVLQHDLPPAHPRCSHWDLMIESNGVLLTWALENWPPQNGLALRLPDHSTKYLEYEGPVGVDREGNDRGKVTQVESGTCNLTQLNESTVDGIFAGKNGSWSIQLFAAGNGDRWELKTSD